MLKFKIPAVEEKYESDFDNDPIIHVPGGRKGSGWKGKLSAITPEFADKCIAQGWNGIRLKSADKPVKIESPAKELKSPANQKAEVTDTKS